MVFAVQAFLAFRNTARRNLISSNIETRLAQNVPWGTTERVDTVTPAGDPAVALEVRFLTRAEADSFRTDVEAFVGTGVNGPLTGVSFYTWHDCPHDQTNGVACVVSGSRVW